ncbi:MAG: hypothetical protein IPO18_01885 [bacterium]|nr:hypothetical protein [bacterium]
MNNAANTFVNSSDKKQGSDGDRGRYGLRSPSLRFVSARRPACCAD